MKGGQTTPSSSNKLEENYTMLSSDLCSTMDNETINQLNILFCTLFDDNSEFNRGNIIKDDIYFNNSDWLSIFRGELNFFDNMYVCMNPAIFICQYDEKHPILRKKPVKSFACKKYKVKPTRNFLKDFETSQVRGRHCG